MHCWLQLRPGSADGDPQNWSSPVWVPAGEVPSGLAPGEHFQWVRAPFLDGRAVGGTPTKDRAPWLAAAVEYLQTHEKGIG